MFRQFREEVLQLAADHGCDDLVVFHGAHRGVQDEPPVAEHDDVVGELAHLLHLVGGEQQSHTLVAQLPHHRHQALHLTSRDRTRGLIQEDDAGTCAGRLDDFDDLADADGQSAHPTSGVDVDPELLQVSGGLFDHGLAPQTGRTLELAADKNVLVHRHLEHRGEFCGTMATP